MQALHLKCLLCQTNKLMCCHFKPNPVPATNNITHADIISISHLHLLSVYYQDLNRDNRYLSHAALHLKCLLCQTNKLMCCHFKPNPVATSHQQHYTCRYHIDLTSTSALCVLSGPQQRQQVPCTCSFHTNLSTLLLCAIYNYTHHLHHIGADSSIPCYMLC